MPGLHDFVEKQQVARRTKGRLASVKFANELADAISRLGPVPQTGNVTSPGPHGRDDAALVTVTSAVDVWFGAYLGYRRRGVSVQFDPTTGGTLGTDSENQFGEAPDDLEEIYILNAAEEGTETHALLDPDAFPSKTHVGFKLNMSATDGKPVYVINGSAGGDCTTP